MILKQIILSTMLLLTIMVTKAQIVYTDINPDVTSTIGVQDEFPYEERDIASIDFNGDKNKEYDFRWDLFTVGTNEWYMHITFVGSNNKVYYVKVNTEEFTAFVEPMELGDAIQSTLLRWDSRLEEPLLGDHENPNFRGLGDRYIGCRFQIGTNTHYGWIRVSLDNNLNFTVKDYAYNAVPDGPINAGDKGTSSTNVPVSSITVAGQDGVISVAKTATLQMVATVAPPDATVSAVTWSVLPDRFATISPTGLLTARADGTVTVTATATDGSGISDSAEITITAPPVLVSFITVTGQGDVTSITRTATLQMVATVTPADAIDKTVTWIVTPPNVATINSETGLLTAKADGTVTVTATAIDGSNKEGTTKIIISNTPTAASTIKYTDINPDVTTTLESPPGFLNTLVPIDFNDDGIEDYNFKWLYLRANAWFLYITTQSENKRFNFESGILRPLEYKTIISVSLNWDDAKEHSIGNNPNPNFRGLGDRYIGCRFQIGANAHYGWIRVSLDNNLKFTVKDYAYNTVPEGPINAGDKGTSSVNIPVSTIKVAGQGDTDTIATAKRTLQMEATILPADASVSAVTWSVSTDRFATISPTGLLTAIADGTVTVTATAIDDSDVSDSMDITITTPVSNIAVAGQDGTTSVAKTATLQMVATVLPADATVSAVTWSVSSTDVATINSATGLLTAKADGTVTVTATATDGSGISGSKDVTISTPVSSITVAGKDGATSVAKTATLQMVATVAPATATVSAVTWSVRPPTWATINSETGQLTAIADGTVTVTATATDGSGISGSKDVTISTPVSSITVAGQDGATSVAKTATLQMVATVAPATATVSAFTWSVRPPTWATINSETGQLTAIADGTVTVTATATDGSGISGSKDVTISTPVTSITVAGKDGATSVAKTATLQMVATVAPADATVSAVTWSVSPDRFATISPTGLLTARADGTVTVTATATDGSNKEGTTTITISNTPILVSSISVAGQGGANTIATSVRTLQMVAAILPANANNKEVTWTATPTTVATINSASGLLTAIADGTVTVTATATDGSNKEGTTTITISNTPILVSSISVAGQGGATTIATATQRTLQMVATLQPTTASIKTVTWSVAPTNLANIDRATGLLTALADGTVTVTATDSSGISGSTDITISNTPILVSSISVAGQDGATTIATATQRTLQMVATLQPTTASIKTVTWSVAPTNLANIDRATGLLTALADGTVTVTATDSSGISGSTDITITTPASTITVAGQGGATTIATATQRTLQMVATVAPADATVSAVTWSVAPTNLANIDRATGLLTALADGTVTVTATATDGTGIEGTTTITISNTPTISTPVTSITVAGQDGATTIETTIRTLQMVATVLPADATLSAVTWSVSPLTLATINSATGLLTAKADGTVTVTATATDGTSIEGTTTITITAPPLGLGVDEKYSFSFFPNPATHTLSFQNDNQFEIQKIIVSYLSGKVIMEKSEFEDNRIINLDISELSNGIYLLNIKTANKTIVERFIVK